MDKDPSGKSEEEQDGVYSSVSGEVLIKIQKAQAADSQTPETPAKRPKLHFSQAYTLQELSEKDPNRFPYKSVVEVSQYVDGKRTRCFQPLEEKDPEEVGMDGYRGKEVEKILELLEEHDLVCLLGPSRSAKSEEIFFGKIGKGIYKRINANLFDGQSYYGAWNERSVNNALEEIEGKREKSSSNIVLFDEYNEDPFMVQLVTELINRGFKVVVCIGGRKSNAEKVQRLRNIEEHLAFKECPVVDVSIKPLNRTQLQKFIDAKIEKKESFEIGDQIQLQEVWNTIMDLSEELPIPYFTADELSTEIIWEIERIKEKGGSYRLCTLSEEDWKKKIQKDLATDMQGSIHQIDSLTK